MDRPDKVAERWWAKFLGGLRRASQGMSFQDVEGHWFVGEHKYRILKQYSAEFRKAIQQHDANKDREKKGDGRVPLILFTFHEGVGQSNRRFLMIEVYPSDGDIVSLLSNLLERIKKQPKNGTNTS